MRLAVLFAGGIHTERANAWRRPMMTSVKDRNTAPGIRPGVAAMALGVVGAVRHSYSSRGEF